MSLFNYPIPISSLNLRQPPLIKRPNDRSLGQYCFAVQPLGMVCELLSCKLRCGYDTQLLHHAELIKDAPTFGNLTIRKSVYDYPGDSG